MMLKNGTSKEYSAPCSNQNDARYPSQQGFAQVLGGKGKKKASVLLGASVAQ